jgi:hypothetical protein
MASSDLDESRGVQMTRSSHSVGQILSAFDWVWENLQFLRMRLKGLGSKQSELAELVAGLDAYRELYQSITGLSFDEARIFEVGYGARPLRLLSLIAMGLDARGVDLDAPMLQRSVGDLLRVLHTNGPLRLEGTFRSMPWPAA